VTQKAPETPLHPVCIRFKPRDASFIRAAAAQDGEIATAWIREAVLLRLSRLASKLPVDLLRFESVAGFGVPISVRFQPKDYRKIVRATSKELKTQPKTRAVFGRGYGPSSWIRAVAVAHAAARASRGETS
jgi:hypothetical protein